MNDPVSTQMQVHASSSGRPRHPKPVAETGLQIKRQSKRHQRHYALALKDDSIVCRSDLILNSYHDRSSSPPEATNLS